MMTTTKPRPVSLAALTRTMARLFAWWGRELAALVPDKLRLWWQGSDRIVLLTLDGSRAVFAHLASGKQEEFLTVGLGNGDLPAQRAELLQKLPRSAGKDFRLLLCLPPEKVLRRKIGLPLAVEENLRQTLTFELDRYTPFKPDQAYFDFRVLERDMAGKRLTAELAVVQQSTVDHDVARAAALNLAVGGVVLVDDILTNQDYFNFLPATNGAKKRGARSWWRLGLGALASLLLIAFLAIPIWQKRTAAIGLVTPLEQAKAAARNADALRDRLNKLVEEHNFVLDKKWGSHSTVLVLEEFSKLLTDDTYLMQLDFDGKTVQIQGESAAASGLVELLEASPLFKDVGFKAQLTKIQGTPNDRFHIAATLEADAKPKPPRLEPQPAPTASPTESPAVPAAPAALMPAAAPTNPPAATANPSGEDAPPSAPPVIPVPAPPGQTKPTTDKP